MDELARQLREDADRIECKVSDELDRRIRASLEGTTPERRAGRRPWRPAAFWWASSLTGVALAAAVVVVLNLPGTEPPPAPAKPLVLPDIEWQVKTAELTTPLEQEMDDLESDLKKTQDVVKQDIDRLF
jgi:hypothetical protein